MKTFLIIALLNSPELAYKAFEFPTEQACAEALKESKLPKGSPAITFCAPRAVHDGTFPKLKNKSGNT